MNEMTTATTTTTKYRDIKNNEEESENENDEERNYTDEVSRNDANEEERRMQPLELGDGDEHEDDDESKEPLVEETDKRRVNFRRKNASSPRAINGVSCLVLVLMTLVLATLVVVMVPQGSPSSSPLSPSHKRPRRSVSAPPFSTVNPKDLSLARVTQRPEGSTPLARLFDPTSPRVPIPTNAWFENVLLVAPDGSLRNENQIYTLPYLIQPVSQGGLHISWPWINGGSGNVVQLEAIGGQGMTMGTLSDTDSLYQVTTWSNLGITLSWENQGMRSSLVRGMPYVTMHYEKGSIPVLTFESSLRFPLHVDNKDEVEQCPPSVAVQRELQLQLESDMTWMMFVSSPVQVHCNPQEDSSVELQLIATSTTELTVRVAISETCSTGTNGYFCASGTGTDLSGILRKHANVYPGENTHVSWSSEDETMDLIFDWDPVFMSEDEDSANLIMYALPHHFPTQPSDCVESFIGKACLIATPTSKDEEKSWIMPQDLTYYQPSFFAPRPPRAQDVEALVTALQTDITAFHIPDNFKLAAGDTYFSGKILAKLGRILMIRQELQQLKSSACTDSEHDASSCVDFLNHIYVNRRPEEEDSFLLNATATVMALQDVDLPSDKDFDKALDELRHGVQIWLDTSLQPEAPFVYDAVWGGIVSCGCWYEDGHCTNPVDTDDFPHNCPSLSDAGLNFGHGYYSDHHFHQGYHIYAAAVVSLLDPEWGKTHFEHVVLLIRDFCNPSEDDVHFPLFRNKDWYMGNSWAGGIVSPPPLFGRNQESSSEAIAAYEAVALYGKVMVDVWGNDGDEKQSRAKVAVSEHIRQVGRLLLATEVRATQRYWHVLEPGHPRRIYPNAYQGRVVGIFWTTMMQFSTWFGGDPVFVYGIQLLPLTPVSEQRDSDVEDWISYMYPVFAQACEASSEVCVGDGWSVLRWALAATLGHATMARDAVLQLPAESFLASGGNGHSLTNTLWYIATRPGRKEPYDIDFSSSPAGSKVVEAVDCNCPTDVCTNDVLQSDADGISCLDRIEWLRHAQGKTIAEACRQVAVDEFPNVCGACYCGENENDKKEAKNAPDEEDNETEQDNVCGCPQTCTASVLEAMADGYSCASRIAWLQTNDGGSATSTEACRQVAVKEFPEVCGGCDPDC